MNLPRFLAMAAAILATSAVDAGEPALAPSSVPSGKGAVEASGKFVPSGTPVASGPAESREQAEAKLRESLKVTQEAPHRFRIGMVSFDRERRTVTIPAMVNLVSGVVEYGLVTESGKIHEALFTTKVNPAEIHLACLLLGMAAGDDRHRPPKPEDESSRIQVSVSWDTNGPAADHELAALVVTAEDPGNPADAKPLPSGPWTYSGSVTDSAGFAAAREGSVISLIGDPAALVVNPRESSKRDDQHVPNSRLLPAKGSPVRIILTLRSPPPDKP